MRTWRLARFSQWCGGCRTPIIAGDKLLEIHTATSTLVRCQACGEAMFPDEKAPAEIPEDPAAAPLDLDALRRQPRLDLRGER